MSEISQVSLLTVRRSPANTRRVGAAAIILLQGGSCLHSLRLTAGRAHAGMVDISNTPGVLGSCRFLVISRTCVRHCDGASASVVRQACVMPQVQHLEANLDTLSLNFVELKGRS